MVFLDEKVIVFLYDKVFVMDNFGLFYSPEQFIVNFGPLVDELEFGLVALYHPAVQLPLNQKGDNEPVNTNQPIHMAFPEQQYDGYKNRKGSFDEHVHIFKHRKNKFQVDIFQLNNLRLVNPISTGPLKSECFPYQLLAQ